MSRQPDSIVHSDSARSPVMLRMELILVVASALIVGGCCPSMCVRDIGPNTPNKQKEQQKNSFTAGLTKDLAGDDDLLYALSLNAGVFRARNGGPWIQLSKSPPLATKVVADPNNSSHVLVGEHNSDATPTRLVASGLWESYNAGDSWQLVLEPARRSACQGDNLQAVPAMLISPTSGAVFAGTQCGIARRSSASQPTAFEYDTSLADIGSVTALVASVDAQGRTLLWGRARRNTDQSPVLLWSDNDGASWNEVPIPTRVGGYGTLRVPRGADETIAAFGETAVLVFRPDGTSDPAKWLDGRDNFCTLLYYSKANGTFSVQAFPTEFGDGTGLGGRLSLHVFAERPGEIAPLASGTTRVHLFFNTAQVVLEGIQVDAIGHVIFSPYAKAAGEPPDPDRQKLHPFDPDTIHSDWWVVHRAFTSGTVRIGTDGGVVYEEANPLQPDGSEPQKLRSWYTQNDGLHTHHVHNLVTIPTSKTARISYVTTDNDEWYRNGDYYGYGDVENWHSYHALGDANWVAADSFGPAAAYAVRAPTSSHFTDFGEGFAPGAGVGGGDGVTLLCHPDPASNGKFCNGDTELTARTFAVIQTGIGETPEPLLDAAMFVQPPLSWNNSGTLVQPITSEPLATASSKTGGPLLIRNRKLLKSPDVNKSQYADWAIVADNVPVGANALWVTGGHESPVYIVYAPQQPGGPGVAWRMREGETAWSIVTEIGAPVIEPTYNGYQECLFSPFNNVRLAEYGPLFVDPYQERHVFALTADGVRDEPAQGITVPVGRLVRDDALTAIVSKSGMYSLVNATIGSNRAGVSKATQADCFPKAVIAQVAFDPNRPGASIVAAPHAGLFYQSALGQPWRDITPRGRPMGMWSTVAFGASGSVIFGTEGHSVWEITDFEDAPLACYFVRTAGGLLLTNSLGTRVVHAKVDTTHLTGTDSVHTTVLTGSKGEVPIQGNTGDVFRVSFAGGKMLAPCDIALAL